MVPKSSSCLLAVGKKMAEMLSDITRMEQWRGQTERHDANEETFTEGQGMKIYSQACLVSLNKLCVMNLLIEGKIMSAICELITLLH